MLVSRPGRGTSASQNAKGGEGERGSQSVVWPVYHAGYATLGMSLAFTREVWRRYLANDVDYVMFSTLK